DQRARPQCHPPRCASQAPAASDTCRYRSRSDPARVPDGSSPTAVAQAANGLRARRSCPAALPAPPSAAPARCRPGSAPTRSEAPDTPDLHRWTVVEPLARVDSTSRSLSAAASPATHTRPVPCTPAGVLADERAAAPQSAQYLSALRTPPGALRRAHLRVPTPPPAAHPGEWPVPPLSPPARSDNPGSSPADHYVPGTPVSHPLATDPGRRSCTFAQLDRY